MISYNPLWHTLIERKIGKIQLMESVGFSRGTLAKLSHNEYVALNVIDKICQTLNCPIEQVIAYVTGETIEGTGEGE